MLQSVIRSQELSSNTPTLTTHLNLNQQVNDNRNKYENKKSEFGHQPINNPQQVIIMNIF